MRIVSLVLKGEKVVYKIRGWYKCYFGLKREDSFVLYIQVIIVIIYRYLLVGNDLMDVQSSVSISCVKEDENVRRFVL